MSNHAERRCPTCDGGMRNVCSRSCRSWCRGECCPTCKGTDDRPAIKRVHNHSPEDCIGCHTVYERGYSDGRKPRHVVTDAMAEAARQASYDEWAGEHGPKVNTQEARRMVRAALEAAAQVGQEN